ncbi:ankyrin repeat and MYND domain-containing protein 2-like, partial [Sinocyclocheilus rhinocerous]|uniref:ankyrin repeat and MYND domain-containing protein 2-like n=1 Tax=Sinocyclocheilus rhinocerous TaxID=307959 RepID=UPI0007B86CFB
LLKGRDSDGFLVFQEKFIRECIRKFPYCDATLLQQLVRSIAPVEIGSDPTALSVLTQAITGQVGFMDADFCATCGEKGAEKRCSICKMVIYCDQACQKLHWFSHKKVCKMLQEQREKHESESASRLQKQAKGIQTQLVLHYYVVYEKYHGIIVFFGHRTMATHWP